MPFYRHFLWPLAFLYGLGVWIRNRLFDLKLLKSREFDVPIICIGNLETGGTGKSPLVMRLVGLLRSNGLNVATLSRGYGRVTSGFLLVETNSKAKNIGDEPCQIKSRFTDVLVAVCENRVKGVENLMQLNPKLDVIIMDDGFQHRWVKPSLNILVTPSKRPFWHNALLPVGSLRESVREAVRADILIVSGEEKLRKNNFNGPVFQARTVVEKPVHLYGPKTQLINTESVFLLSGIGNSWRFEQTVKESFKVLGHFAYSDHHYYSLEDLSHVSGKIMDNFGSESGVLLTTEKDAMRLLDLKNLNQLGNISLFYLPITVLMDTQDAANFDKMILDHAKHA